MPVLHNGTGKWYDFYWKKVNGKYEKTYDKGQKEWALD